MTGSPQQTDAPQRTRDLIRQLLLNPRLEQTDPYALFWFAQDYARGQGWTFDWSAGIEYWWDLARGGVVAILGGASSSAYARGPTFVVARGGREKLADDRVSPYEKTRYLQALRTRVPDPDPLALAYLDEAVAALTMRMHRASMVMLGVACERLIIMLAEAVRGAKLVPYSEKLAKMLASDPPTGVAVVFEYVRQALVEAGKLPGDLADEIDRNLTPIFERARGLRNKHGHPTGAPVSVEDAEAGLLLFPGFYSLVARLVTHLGTLGKEGNSP